MALVLADRVQQTGTANTTVSFTLSGSVTGYQSFSVIGNTNTTYYAATDASGNWEVGLGTYSTTGPTLTRTTILSSSNSGSAVTFSGTVNVFVTYPSERSVYSNGTNIVPDNAATLLPSSGGTGQSTYTNGQLLIGNTTGNTLTKSTLTAGSGISITNGTGSITIATATADVQTFTGSGTWTKPSTGQFVRIQMWGGGGGGSRSSTAINTAAGGGGGYYETTVPIASMGATATVTVGAAGTGRTASTGVGTAGGNSSVTAVNGSTIYVSGGLGGDTAGGGGSGGYGGLLFTTTQLSDKTSNPTGSGNIGGGGSSCGASGDGYSYTGGGGGGGSNTAGGRGGWGGGGGTRGAGAGGTSALGGAGGNSAGAGVQPGGGGGASTAINTNATNGALGQVIITTY